MKKLLTILLALILVLSLAACQQSSNQTPAENQSPTQAPADTTTPAATEPELKPTDSLVLYTSAGASEYELIVNEFNKKYPDIKVEVVSAGTGELASRITAEKQNPYGDVLMGGGATTYLGIADMLEPYASENKANLFPEFLSDNDLFTPCYINVNSIIINKTLINKLGVTVDGWQSLTDERLKGNISYASPADSSSALETMINMMTAMSASGDPKDGWDYVEKFLTNLDGKLASSSSAAYQSVVNGEYAVGLTNEDKAISYMKEGADVTVAYPKEGITLRTSNIAVIKGGANAYNARLFVDFVTSKECQTAMESDLNVRPSRSDVPMTTEGRVETAKLVSLAYPKDIKSSDIKTGFQDMWTKIQ